MATECENILQQTLKNKTQQLWGNLASGKSTKSQEKVAVQTMWQKFGWHSNVFKVADVGVFVTENEIADAALKNRLRHFCNQ